MWRSGVVFEQQALGGKAANSEVHYPRRLQSCSSGYPCCVQYESCVACGVEAMRRMALPVLLLISDIVASSGWRTYFCGEILSLRCVISVGFVVRTVPSAVFKYVSVRCWVRSFG